jgi:cytoskeletal protein CcmA (bactofilin family)
MHVRRVVRVLPALAILGLASPAWPQQAGDRVEPTGVLEGDQYLAGRVVTVRARVRGDVFAAGAAVRVEGEVEGDVAAAAGEVEVAGPVADDVRVVGGQVHLRGRVGDEVVAAGGEVVLHRESWVGGRARLAGRRVVVEGSIGRGVDAAGEQVEIDGEVAGDVAVAAERVVVGPRARIGGSLSVTSPEPPRIAEGARIAGPVSFSPARGGGAGGRAGALLRAVALQVGLFLLAWAWLVLAPGLARQSARVERGELALSLGFGVAVLFGLPVVAAGLALTFVGLPLAAAALASWVLVALAGWVTTATCLGDWLRERAGRGGDRLGSRLVGVAVALGLLRLLAAVPILGWAVVAGALAFGAGGAARAAQRAHARARVAAGAPGTAAPPGGEGIG